MMLKYDGLTLSIVLCGGGDEKLLTTTVRVTVDSATEPLNYTPNLTFVDQSYLTASVNVTIGALSPTGSCTLGLSDGTNNVSVSITLNIPPS